MTKMVQKSLEINDNFKKLSPNNQARVNHEMQQLFNAMYIKNDVILINRFRNTFMNHE